MTVSRRACRVCFYCSVLQTSLVLITISIYKLGGISSNLIGSFSIANGQYSISREVAILRSKKYGGVNARFAEVGLRRKLCKYECVVLSPSLYILTQLFFAISVNSDFENFRPLSPRFQRIIVKY